MWAENFALKFIFTETSKRAPFWEIKHSSSAKGKVEAKEKARMSRKIMKKKTH